MYAAKQTALMQNPNAQYILIRADVHPNTYNTQTGKVMKDDFHITIDYKDAQMFHDQMHQTVHGYIAVNSVTGTVTNMWNVGTAVPKTGELGLARKVENDAWFDKRRNKNINNWDMSKLTEVVEPDELVRVRLGDNFITALSEDLAKLDDKMKAAAKAEAEKEENEARKRVKEEWDALLTEKT